MKIHKRGEMQIAEFIVFVILLVCHVFPLQANVAVVRNLDNGSGLQDPQVNCITKDSKGFIWFGTLNTIQRFDGVRFKCFNFPEWVEKVFVIKEIENNDFWVGTNKGLWKYEVRSGTFLRIYAEINFPVRSLCYIMVRFMWELPTAYTLLMKNKRWNIFGSPMKFRRIIKL